MSTTLLTNGITTSADCVITTTGANAASVSTNGSEKFRIAGDATGTITIGGTAPRITGDLSNATIASRVFFQTSTANGNSIIGVMPNGTGNTGAIQLNNSSDTANTAFLNLYASSTFASIDCNARGTGTYVPLTFTTSGIERARIDTSGNVLIGTTSSSTRPTTSGSLSAPNTFGFKNRLINGDFTINQRGLASYTINNAGAYTVDRWFGSDLTDGVFTVQPTTGPTTAGFPSALRVTVTTADASIGSTQQAYVAQAIEGVHIADFAWGTASAVPVTLSFWVRASATGTYGGSLTNASINMSYAFTYSISAANTWEQKSITIAGPTSGTWNTNNAGGITLRFSLAAGSSFSGAAGSWVASDRVSATGARNVLGTLNATWDIAGVQLEKGTAATSFDFRPLTTEINLCFRYYQLKNITIGGYAAAGSAIYNAVIYPIPVRASPTVAWGAVVYANTTTFGIGAIQPDSFTAFASLTVSASGTAAVVYTIDAEL
jgi:hypothetical protein